MIVGDTYSKQIEPEVRQTAYADQAMIDSLNHTLNVLAAAYKTDNPDYEVIVDEGAVWVRTETLDLGIYSTTIDGVVIDCVVNGRTCIHRPRKEAP